MLRTVFVVTFHQFIDGTVILVDPPDLIAIVSDLFPDTILQSFLSVSQFIRLFNTLTNIGSHEFFYLTFNTGRVDSEDNSEDNYYDR